MYLYRFIAYETWYVKGICIKARLLEVLLRDLDLVPGIANDGVLAHVLIVCCELTGLFRGSVVKFVNERVPANLIARAVLGVPLIDLKGKPELHRCQLVGR